MYIYTCKSSVQLKASVRVFLSARVERTISLLWYLQPRPSLPTPEQTGIGERATAEANAAVAEVLGDSGHSNGRKRKCYTAFSDEDRAAIERHSLSQNA